MPKNVIAAITAFIFSYSLFAQNALTLHGEVVDKHNNPVFGATIQSNVTGESVLAGKNGFIIKLSQFPDTLIISAVGYQVQKRIIYGSESEVKITLDEFTNELNEVTINTGYQKIPKERSTGSFYLIDSTVFNQRVGPNVLDRLDGITSSLLVDNRKNSVIKYQMRGLSTLTANAATPLIILDNFPYSGDINNINPNDVESISILKDAAATSIWGARAGNGVIVITTKRAHDKQAMQISFNSNLTIKPRPDLFSAYQMNSSDYIDLEEFLFAKGFFNSDFSNVRRPIISPVVEILQQEKLGQITAEQAKEQINAFRGIDMRSDMEKYLYRPSYNQQYSLGIAGASDFVNYRFSIGLDKGMANLAGNDNNRITIRSDNVVHLTKRWDFNPGLILTKTHSTQNSPGGFGSFTQSIAGITPYTRLVNNDGTPAVLDLYYRGVFTDTAGNGQLLDWKFRPLDELKNNNNFTDQSDVVLNLTSSYKLTNWLTAKAAYQYENDWTDNYQIHNLKSFFARDLVNEFTEIIDGTPIYHLPKGGVLVHNGGKMESQSGRFQLNIDKTWNTKNQLSVIIGSELRDMLTTSDSRRDYGYDETTLATQMPDYTTQFQTYDNVRGKTFILNATNSSKFTNRFVSLYSNGSYTYNNRYIISGSFRKDASNFFGVKTNQKWVPLWSVGGAWRISNEDFYRIDWLPELKFRMTYGFSGNLDPNASALTTISYLPASRNNPIHIPAATVSQPANPDLRWERVKQLNFGADFSMLNNYISGSIEYYTKKSIDLMNVSDLDPITGFNSVRKNSATLGGHGVDITLNTLNLNRKVKWKSTILLSYTSFKVLKTNYANASSFRISDGTSIFAVDGYNPYLVASYKFAGLDPATGDPLGYVDGEISKDYYAIFQNPLEQNVISGQALPPIFGSVRNSIQFKGFTLAANITYRLNYYFRKPSISYYSLIYNGSVGYEFEKRWQKPGDEKFTSVPSFIYPMNSNRTSFYNFSDINVDPADNIKLNDVY
ncbi:SusC/RagA family TonB-linked outer membrane protein [Arachidicoccus ginsenosidivorans]|uniref:SusC/RagA family TonB-linked outer membrane protein n=1 Tax=Arachidicoccus ginsenosidivorans TaxID=496057 RepID=A0A5B8VTK2_9BACT|nr:SusC/RagA family TonB-linked outer membrane protein [Arachidicoccus ginsenosidivorans]QEC73478.1 SusC/RagA family TonB-linked outer membrane protein [Arachidicoccus ginsenosidivorans]